MHHAWKGVRAQKVQLDNWGKGKGQPAQLEPPHRAPLAAMRLASFGGSLNPPVRLSSRQASRRRPIQGKPPPALTRAAAHSASCLLHPCCMLAQFVQRSSLPCVRAWGTNCHSERDATLLPQQPAPSPPLRAPGGSSSWAPAQAPATTSPSKPRAFSPAAMVRRQDAWALLRLPAQALLPAPAGGPARRALTEPPPAAHSRGVRRPHASEHPRPRSQGRRHEVRNVPRDSAP